MFEFTVNELARYTMADHKGGDTKIHLQNIIKYPKVVLTADQDISEAASVIVRERCTGLSVIGANRELLGYLSEKDCLKKIYEEELNQTVRGTVKDYMSKNVFSFTTDTPIYKVLDAFISNNFHTYPVTENGKFVGEVRRRDLLKILLDKNFDFY